MPPKKRAASKTTEKAEENEENSPKNAKMNKTETDHEALDFSNDSKTAKGGNKWNFKISTWNVAGLRAWLKKDGIKYLENEQPDVMCIQETKCSDAKLPGEIKDLKDYPHKYWFAAQKEGYSGVALLSKVKPLSVEKGLGEKAEDFDAEGRTITAEFETFFLVTTYVPNAGKKLVNLEKRMEWDPLLRSHLKKLDEKKPVILCGDLNVAHQEIDLKNPKTNKKNAGFTQEERDGFTALLKENDFVDTFRKFYPDKEGMYTFWTYMMNARAKNAGWRLDYFVVSERFVDTNVCDNVIRNQVFGSDHCPSTLFLHLDKK